MKAWDIAEAIKKSFHKAGSGGSPIVFLDADNGDTFEFKDVKYDDKNCVTVVTIQLKED